MTWKKIQETVCTGLHADIIECRNPATVTAMLQDLIASNFEAMKGVKRHEETYAYAEKACEIVMKWDVRCVIKLRELFPQHFPPSLSKGQLLCYMADNKNADWMVERV